MAAETEQGSRGAADSQADPQTAMRLTSPLGADRPRVALSFGTFILVGVYDGVIGVLLPSIILAYGLTKATVSLIFPASAAGYLLAALNSGALLARLGRRRLLALGAGLWTVGLLTVGMAPPFAVIPVAVFCAGFGVAIIDAGLNAYIAGLPRGAGLLNYLHAFYGVGALLGPALATFVLLNGLGWNFTAIIIAAGISLALVGYLTIFRGVDTAPQQIDQAGQASQASDGAGEARRDENTAERRAERTLLAETLRSPVIWLCAIFLCVYVGVEVSLGSWTYSLLTEARRVAALPASRMISGYWVGLTLGRVALGHIADRAGPRRLIQLAIIGVALALVLVWFAPSVWLAALGLLLTGFCLGPIFPSSIALISQHVSPRLQQSAIGFAASLGSMGAALFPFLAGMLAQRAGLGSLPPYALGLAVVMFGLWRWFTARLDQSDRVAHGASEASALD